MSLLILFVQIGKTTFTRGLFLFIPFSSRKYLCQEFINLERLYLVCEWILNLREIQNLSRKGPI
jgi:hypothetical protein